MKNPHYKSTLDWLHGIRFFVRIVLTFLPYAALSTATAADWPQWRGINRDGKSTETDLLKVWPPDGPKRIWQVEALGEGHASMAVANGRIYTTGMLEESNEGVLSAIDLQGNLLWQRKYGPEWTEGYPGARSCPTVDGNRVYAVSGTGRIVCLDAKSGEMLWSRDMTSDLGAIAPKMGFAESPIVIGKNVYCTPGGNEVCIAALDKLTGKTVATTKSLSDKNAYCSPIYVEKGGQPLLITLTDIHLVGVDPRDCGVVWSTPFDENEELQNHSVSPIYVDGHIYVTSAHRTGGTLFTLAESGKSVTQGWSDETLCTLHGGVVAVNGFIYGSSNLGKWVCVDIRNGQIMYEQDGVGKGSIIYANGMLYCYGEKGDFALVEAIPDSFRVVSQFKIREGKGPHWAHPVIAGGRLYIRQNGTISAYQIKTP
ncbi:MAG: hypothetical protein AMXMBFR84_46230 [Candidatus Hydrogenedentota bacterium]